MKSKVLKQKIANEILKKLYKFSSIFSVSIVGSYINNNSLKSFSDIDTVAITNNLNKKLYFDCINSLTKITSCKEKYENNKMSTRLWNGISNVRVNCGTAIVGDVDQVAEELLGYWELGIDEFILSGFPHVEECKTISEQLLPVLVEKIGEKLAV